jgi:hypothetical protein
MTATFDIGNFGTDEFYPGWKVFSITGHDVADPVAQAGSNAASKGGGDSESHTTATLGSAVTTGNLLLGLFHAQNDVSAAFTTPSGFTAHDNLTGTFMHNVAFYRDDTTAQSVTCTDLGQTVWFVLATVLEINAAAAGAVYPPYPRRQNSLVRM